MYWRDRGVLFTIDYDVTLRLLKGLFLLIPMDFSAALPTFVITLREGVEAALVVGIVLACLKKAEKTALNGWAFAGIGAGVAGSAVLGLVLTWAFGQVHLLAPELEAVVEPLLKVGLCGVAIAMLSWMLIWMTRQAKSLKGEIEGAVAARLDDSTVTSAGWGVFWLVWIAVLREGFETVVFILANAQQGLEASLGAVAGLVGAVAIGVALFKFGVRINIGRFFQVMGVLLLLIVAGLTTSFLKSADAGAIALGQLNGTDLCFADGSCVLGPLFWDLSGWLPQGAFPGLILKVMLGYRDHLYWAQAIVYVAFLSSVGSLYFRSLGGGKPKDSKRLSGPLSS